MKEGKTLSIVDIIAIVDLYCKDDESRNNWRNELVMDLGAYYEKTKDFISNILDIEIPFSYINKDVVVNGQTDLVIRNKENEIEIIDFKSRVKTGIDKMNADVQLRLYNIALENRYQEKIKKLGAYTVKDNILTRFTNNPEDLEKTKSLVSSISDSINQGEFKRKWQGTACSTKMGRCEFYHICNSLEEDENNGR